MLSKEEFRDVYNVHFDAIRRYLFYRCGDEDLASDVAQDVFMKIWEKRLALNGNPIVPLLYKIAAGYYSNSYQKKLRKTDFEQNMLIADDVELSPEEEMMFKELTSNYSKMLGQMSDKQRTVFMLNREEGMKYAEIADILRISVKTVEKHISAALRMLRKKL
jgi:RNA polymerase sigma-70 factor (ECF subfamily)